MRKIFVAGTDTGVGKTTVAKLLLSQLSDAGYSTAALKPVAAGSESIDGQKINSDTALLANACSDVYPTEEVTPFLFDEAIAPHIAARNCGEMLDVTRCMAKCQNMLQLQTDFLIIEGAGGWLVPLNEHETLADLAIAMQADILLVVGMRLGCINHALLSAAAIKSSGLRLLGWVANTVDPTMPERKANIETLCQRIEAPLLADIEHIGNLDKKSADEYFPLKKILSG